jgi:hypothetical protein
MIYLINADPSPTKENSGMKTVDLAWDVFLKRNNLNIPYRRFSIKEKAQKINVTKKVTLSYESSFNLDFHKLHQDDIVVYWGDFIHANLYMQNDLSRITKKKY